MKVAPNEFHKNDPDVKGRSSQNIAKIKKSCDDFEAIFMKQMLDVSLKNVAVVPEGPGHDIIKGMYIDELANKSNGQLGISKILFDYLKKEHNLHVKN